MSDIDDEELEATRKLHGVSKESDIEILENCWLMKTNHVLDEENKKVRQAIENLIKENKELKENYINPSKARISYYDNKNRTQVVIEGFIPKSKVKEHVEKLAEMKVFSTAITKQILDELFKEGE